MGIKNVAVESDLYTIESDAGPSDHIEQALASIEGPLTEALMVLVAGIIPAADSLERAYLSTYMAMQQVRTPESMDRLLFPILAAEFTGEAPISAVAMGRFLHERYLGFAPGEVEVSAACNFANYAIGKGMPDKEQALSMKFDMAFQELAPRLGTMRWSLERCTKPRLITSDRPVALWRPSTDGNRFGGIGIENADEVRFPLSPRDLLVMRHTGPEQVTTVPPGRGSEVSEHLARQCHRLVLAPSDRHHYLKTLRLADRRPAMRFNTGPLFADGPDGTRIEQGEVIHTWVPDSESTDDSIQRSG